MRKQRLTCVCVVVFSRIDRWCRDHAQGPEPLEARAQGAVPRAFEQFPRQDEARRRLHHRVFPSGEVQYLHPKDGVYPEKVNKGRVGANQNMRSIGKNTNPAKIKLKRQQHLRRHRVNRLASRRRRSRLAPLPRRTRRTRAVRSKISLTLATTIAVHQNPSIRRCRLSLSLSLPSPRGVDRPARSLDRSTRDFSRFIQESIRDGSRLVTNGTSMYIYVYTQNQY